MPWVKIDDGFTDHAKVEALSDRAFRLHVAGLCFCARMLTDGVIPEDRVRRLLPKVTKGMVAELVDGNLWKPHPLGFEVVSYLEYNPSKEKVLHDRASAAERKAKFLAKKAAEEAKKNAAKNSVLNTVANGAPAQPDPTQPVGHWVGVEGSQANEAPPTPTAGAPDHKPEPAVLESIRATRQQLKPVPNGPAGSPTCRCEKPWSECDPQCERLVISAGVEGEAVGA